MKKFLFKVVGLSFGILFILTGLVACNQEVIEEIKDSYSEEVLTEQKPYENVDKYIKEYMDKVKPYKGGRWCYEDGIILTGSEYLYLVTEEERYNDFIHNYLLRHLDFWGRPNQYKVEDYNIDNINAGKILFRQYSQAEDARYKNAIDILYSQIEKHPRTESGSFWHKQIYPNQIWLDGLYMAQPFYARYIKEFDENKDYQDIIHQFQNVKKYLWDEERQLYVHAYDDTKSMQWANSEDGKSKNVWSRSVGWYAMALIDVLEIGEGTSIEEKLAPMLKELIDGMLEYQDKNGMWYQIIDGKEIDGNYHETSGTLMMAYTLLKGARLGYLPKEYLTYGVEAFEGTLNEYFYEDQGEFHLGGICQVAGLDGNKRDGSIDYYLSEPVVSDEAKGVAPLMMAYSEMLRLEE